MNEKPRLKIPQHLEKKVEKRIAALQSNPVIERILKKQQAELPRELRYHTYDHIVDVLREAVLFGMHDCLPDTDVELLAIAAAFHDAGFLTRRVRNEVIGADLAIQYMKAEGTFSEAQYLLVHQMILDTALIETPRGPRQLPSTRLSEFLLDADLANFGRVDFLEKAELQRRETGQSEDVFYQKTLELLQAHTYYSSAARQLRGSGKIENIARLQRKLVEMRHSGEQLSYLGVSLDRLGFLTQLPIQLNSALEVREIIRQTLACLNEQVEAEASTIFLTIPESNQIEFWEQQGGTAALSGQRLPAGTGIVGWVIDNNEGVLCVDTESDPRFFSVIDAERGFKTENLICVPLCVRGSRVIGALQCLNSTDPAGFVKQDLLFIEHAARHVALALENAELFNQLQRQKSRLEKIEQRRSDQVALIAHEFRTPLNVIQSVTDLLVDDAPENQDLQGLIRNGVARLVQLIDEVRTLSVVSRDEFSLSRVPFSVRAIGDRVQAHFSPIAANRQLQLEVSVPPLLHALGDAPLILVVLKNLVSNAVRFTPDQGTISVSASSSAGQVEFSVADTGIGISECELEVIFSKFYEVQDIYEHTSGRYAFKSSGLGLGLATVQSILRAHGSSVQVTSKPGSGSRFSFRLPLAPPV